MREMRKGVIGNLREVEFLRNGDVLGARDGSIFGGDLRKVKTGD